MRVPRRLDGIQVDRHWIVIHPDLCPPCTQVHMDVAEITSDPLTLVVLAEAQMHPGTTLVRVRVHRYARHYGSICAEPELTDDAGIWPAKSLLYVGSELCIRAGDCRRMAILDVDCHRA